MISVIPWILHSEVIGPTANLQPEVSECATSSVTRPKEVLKVDPGLSSVFLS